MPTELWTKLLAEAPVLAVLLLVLWKGGERLDKICERFDRLGEKFDKMTLAMKGMSAKIEMVGRLTDARLELHEERTVGTGKHAAVTTAVAATLVRGQANGNPISTRPTPASWEALAPSDIEDEE